MANSPIDKLNAEIERIDRSYVPLLVDGRDSAVWAVNRLKEDYDPVQIAGGGDPQRLWELIGLWYLRQNRLQEALSVFVALYEYLHVFQEKKNKWVHKGMPLVWISDCFFKMGFSVLSKRYFMLTLVEDALRDEGIDPNKGGVYFRAVTNRNLSDRDVRNYATYVFELSLEMSVEDRFFPERILCELDQDWMTEFPSPAEMGFYYVNRLYVKYLLKQLGDGSGKKLEQLAAYLLSCMPGCRTLTRLRSNSTEYDIVCAVDGVETDFRSEFGRYFVCECKDWSEPAGFTTMAKFCRVLDSVKSRFGILFSKNGISGKGKTKNAEHEQSKVFQDRGMVIVVVDEKDIKEIADGENFINMLRKKYERVRLDLKGI